MLTWCVYATSWLRFLHRLQFQKCHPQGVMETASIILANAAPWDVRQDIVEMVGDDRGQSDASFPGLQGYVYENAVIDGLLPGVTRDYGVFVVVHR